MPLISQLLLPPPSDEDEFESLVEQALSARDAQVQFRRFGRQGQSQHGIDGFDGSCGRGPVFQATLQKDKLVGKLERDLDLFDSGPFRDRSPFLFVVGVRRDATLQLEVRRISEERRASGNAPVELVFWEDITQHLSTEALRRHYPEFVPPIGPPISLLASDRIRVLDQQEREAHARIAVRLLALGLSSDEADAMVRGFLDAQIPTPIAKAAGPLQLIVGDFGAGKSLVADQIHLLALAAARSSSEARLPVFLDPVSLRESDVRGATLRAAAPIGSIDQFGVHLVVDGLDQMGPERAFDILNEARALVRVWPRSRAVLTSQPIARLSQATEIVHLPLLDHAASAGLVGRVAGTGPWAAFGGASQALRDTCRRPLFALLLGLHLRRRRQGAPKSEAEMISDIVESALAESPGASEAFEDLATRSIDLGGGPVPIADLDRRVADVLRAEHRLVSLRDGTFVFAVPILAHWFGGQAVRTGRVNVDELIRDSRRTSRWIDALALAIAGASAVEVDAIMSTIARRDPSLAGILVKKAVPESGFDETVAASPKVDVGIRLRNAMNAWVEGLGDVALHIAPLKPDGSIKALGVNAQGAWLRTAWLDDETRDVIELGPDELFGRGARPGYSAGWPWRWTKEDLRSSLKKLMKVRGLPLVDALRSESAWDLGRRLSGYGSLYTGAVPLVPLAKFLAEVPESIVLYDDVLFDLGAIRSWLDGRKRGTKDVIAAPYPGEDRARGHWIWNSYSPEQLLDRTRAIYATALSAYEQIVSSIFSSLAPRFEIGGLFPVVLRGRIDVKSIADSDVRGQPSMTSWFEPLLGDKRSAIDFAVADGAAAGVPNFDAMWAEISRRRPHVSSWGYSRGIVDVHDAQPATQIVYKWLENDLNAVAWWG